MNSNVQTPSNHNATRSSAHIEYLRDRVAKLKQQSIDSHGNNRDVIARLESYEKSLNDLLGAGDSAENTSENDAQKASAFGAQHLAAGQQADKGRTDAGQTADTDRTPSGQSADKPSPRTPLEKELIEDLNEASQSPLDKLSPEDQQRLFDLVTHHPITAVYRVIRLPAPEGWGLSTSRQSLYRFRDRHRELKQREHRRQMKSAAHAVLEDLEGADEQFANASERLLKLRLLETANDPASKTRDLRELFTTLIRLRAVSRHGNSTEKQG
jgi:hypothetical protein